MDEAGVIELVSGGGVFELTPAHFEGRRMTVAEVEAIFKSFGAFWMYQGDPCPEKPHSLLKSKLHSNGFIMCMAVLKHPVLCLLLAHEMLKAIEEKMAPEEISKIDVVASSAYSAINLGWFLAWLLSQKYNKKVEYVIAEKDADGNPTKIRGGIDSKKTVLVINELMTTGMGSTRETAVAVWECNNKQPDVTPPKIIEIAVVLMHRSEDYNLPKGKDNKEIKDDLPMSMEVVPVFHFGIGNYKHDECPWCKAGSEAIKPKLGDNWKILHGET